MAAYAALLSLTFTINQIQQHPRPPISLHHQHLHSLTQNLSFLQNFLETYSTEEDECLESRIADAAYAAEDVIESHIVDQIHAASTGTLAQSITSIDFYQGLEKVIQNMDLIKNEVMEIVEKKKTGAQHHQLIMSMNSSVSVGPKRPISMMQNNTMVDFGDILIDVMDKLTRKDFEIISIVGMGGMGKTTLARNIFTHPLINQHFDILAWVTISPEYSVREILLGVISEVTKEDRISEVHKLGEKVYKELFGRRYLVVMDDIWSIKAWDKVKSFFPKNNNGSKIMITTRLSNLAFQLSGSHDFQMKFLDDDKSWQLFSEIVFGREDCPIELRNIGKEIVRNCRGLPLSIVVIGGLLAKSNMSCEYWEYTLENLSSLINLENNEHCLQILRTSYKELPVHLKPCFLYVGIFPEDHNIYIPNLVRLCVAEGFLKPIEKKSLEQVAKEYIRELIDRNLLLVDELSWKGKAVFCKIHDLVRDLCLREAKKQRFFSLQRESDLNIPIDMDTQRGVCIHDTTAKVFPPRFNQVTKCGPLIRSLIFFSRNSCTPPPASISRLLRVYSCFDFVYSFRRGRGTHAKPLSQQANLRYLSTCRLPQTYINSPCSWHLLWNLQTLEFVAYDPEPLFAPSEIWNMPYLRHVILNELELPIPPYSENRTILERLQTFSGILNLKCSEEVVRRIPNIKTLKLLYCGRTIQEEGLHRFCLNNLGRLQNLKSLDLDLGDGGTFDMTMQHLSLPHSLRKLSLHHTGLLWEDMTTEIGSLPLLEVLVLRRNSCIGPMWKTFEGQFVNLKSLRIEQCDLERWTTDDTQFPCLETIFLSRLPNLKEIPLNIGDIPTLKSIVLKFCHKSAYTCAKIIKEEQLSYGIEDLQVLIDR